MVLDNLSEEHKVVSIQRLAEMRQFSPEMAQKVAHILHRRLESWATRRARLLRLQGGSRPAEPAKRRGVEEDPGDDRGRPPELALSIRNLMFTFEDL